MRVFGSTTAVLVFAALLCVLCAPLRGQNDSDEASAPKAKYSDEDLKKFQKMFDDTGLTTRGDGDVKTQVKHARAKDALIEALRKYENDSKVSSAISDDDAWRRILAANYVTTLKSGKDKAPGARGTVREDFLEIVVQGKIYRFDFAYMLPANYSPDQSWPVIVCLHDKDSTGTQYLKGVWEDDRDSKAIRDQFILIAPTVPQRTPSGDSKEQRGKKLQVDRLGWFDRLHAFSIMLPLKNIRERFNCDPARTYIEGVGLGGQMALDAGVYYGSLVFAGVVSRHAQPKNINLISGLTSVPTLFLYRDGGPMGGKDERFWEDLKALNEREGMKLVDIKQAPAVERVTGRALGNQTTDPMKDANGVVAEWLLTKKQEAYPTSYRFVTNNMLHNRAANLRLNEIALTDEGSVIDCRFEVDKETNSVKVFGSGFGSFTVFLNDSILDLDRTIDVYLNGNLIERRTQKRDVEFMLNGMKANPSLTNRVFTANLNVKVPQGDDGASPDPGGEAKSDAGAEQKK